MPLLRCRYALVPLVIGLVISRGTAQFGPTLQDLAVTVRGASCEFAYTNKKGSFLYGETCGAQRSNRQGPGEFRTLKATPGEWNGGGKLRPGDPNIYDLLEVSVK